MLHLAYRIPAVAKDSVGHHAVADQLAGLIMACFFESFQEGREE
jgi:hypothetical protein